MPWNIILIWLMRGFQINYLKIYLIPATHAVFKGESPSYATVLTLAPLLINTSATFSCPIWNEKYFTRMWAVFNMIKKISKYHLQQLKIMAWPKSYFDHRPALHFQLKLLQLFRNLKWNKMKIFFNDFNFFKQSRYN